VVGLLCRLTRLRRRRSPIDAAPAEAQRGPSMVMVRRTCAPSEPALVRSAPTGYHGARSAQHGPSFSTVRVAPEFSPRDYADTFAALQSPTSSKVLDLVPARLLCADIFERLSGAWTATSDVVPRLGIVLSFERWVMLRDIALAALQPLMRSRRPSAHGRPHPGRAPRDLQARRAAPDRLPCASALVRKSPRDARRCPGDRAEAHGSLVDRRPPSATPTWLPRWCATRC